MKAVIKNVLKETNPRLNPENGQTVDTPVVVVEVEYQSDDGAFHSAARHAFLPDEVDPAVFDRQAEVMQRDIDDAARRERERLELAAVHAPVDNKIDELKNHFKLNFTDAVPLGDH